MVVWQTGDGAKGYPQHGGAGGWAPSQAQAAAEAQEAKARVCAGQPNGPPPRA